MRRLRIAARATRDIDNLLRVSESQFGAQALRRYRLLLSRAYADLREEPKRAGATPLGDAAADLYLYHIRHSRARVSSAERVGSTRHIVVFRFDDDLVEIVRVLHDFMDLERHVANDDGPQMSALK